MPKMMIEDVNEPIEVISYFDGKRMRPLRFRWQGRAYRIERVNGVWDAAKGRSREYHFHVSTRESGSFELIYDNAGFVWRLGRVCLEE